MTTNASVITTTERRSRARSSRRWSASAIRPPGEAEAPGVRNSRTKPAALTGLGPQVRQESSRAGRSAVGLASGPRRLRGGLGGRLVRVIRRPVDPHRVDLLLLVGLQGVVVV